MSIERPLAGDSSIPNTLIKSRFMKIASYCDDAFIMRTAFYGLMIGVLTTLLLDYREMLTQDEDTIAPVVTPRRANPILPAFIPSTEGEEAPQTITPEIFTPPDELNQPMTIQLTGNGVLELKGFIAVGTAERFAGEISNISEYIKTVSLNSPGGSVFDAIAISSSIRENGWTTKVHDGHLCASSCPLIFAGGKKRIAEKKAAIGVHQFFAVGEDNRSTADAISGTQRTTAKITKHLEAMKVDPALWVHALETPPQRLYYFNREELEKFKLVTE